MIKNFELYLAAKPVDTSCDTVQQDGPVYQSYSTSSATYLGGVFIEATASSLVICAISMYFRRSAGDTSNYVLQLWSNNAAPDPDVPGTLLATTETILNADVPTSGLDEVKAALTSPYTLTNGDTYWIVRKKLSANAYSVVLARGDSAPEGVRTSADGSTWASETAAVTTMFRLYSL